MTCRCPCGSQDPAAVSSRSKVFLGPVKVFVLGHHGVAVLTNWNAMGSLGPASAAQLALTAAVTCRCPCGSQKPAAVTVKVFWNGQSFCSGPSQASSVNRLACNGLMGFCECCLVGIDSCSNQQMPVWQPAVCRCDGHERLVKVFLEPSKFLFWAIMSQQCEQIGMQWAHGVL